MKECVLYKSLEDKKVQCTACKQACVIADQNSGICGVRQNKDGKLYLLVYGHASAVNIDPIEKKPLFHFMPGSAIFSLGTVGCNFSCSFCQNWDLSQATKDIKKKLLDEKKLHQLNTEIGKLGHELPPEKIIEVCKSKGIKSIAYTYNEPVIFAEYVHDTAKLAKDSGIKNVLVSNGYETDKALEYLKPYVDAMNIDLKSFDDGFYKKLCHARLQPVLDTIKKAHEIGIWVEVTTLVIPGENDSIKELTSIAEFIASVSKDMPWHVTAFYPQYKMQDKAHTSPETLFRAYDIGTRAGLKYVYTGNISDEEHASTRCPTCKAMLIRRSSYDITVEGLDSGKCKKCGESIAGIWN